MTEPIEEQQAEARGRRKVREGIVVSDKMQKTVVVEVEDRVKHALYGKIVIKSSKYHAHDENGEFHTGDVIEIQERNIRVTLGMSLK